MKSILSSLFGNKGKSENNGFSLRANYKNYERHIVTLDLIAEVIAYVEEKSVQGMDEFAVLNNNETKHYVQCIFIDDAFLVQLSIDIGNGYAKLVEKGNLSDKEVISMFSDFFESNDVDTTGFTDMEMIGRENKFKL